MANSVIDEETAHRRCLDRTSRKAEVIGTTVVLKGSATSPGLLARLKIGSSQLTRSLGGDSCLITVSCGTDRGVLWTAETVDELRIGVEGLRGDFESFCSNESLLGLLLYSKISSFSESSDGDGVDVSELSDLTNALYQFLLGPEDFQKRCCWTCLLTFEAKAASLPVFRDRLGELESLLMNRKPLEAIAADCKQRCVHCLNSSLIESFRRSGCLVISSHGVHNSIYAFKSP